MVTSAPKMKGGRAVPLPAVPALPAAAPPLPLAPPDVTPPLPPATPPLAPTTPPAVPAAAPPELGMPALATPPAPGLPAAPTFDESVGLHARLPLTKVAKSRNDECLDPSPALQRIQSAMPLTYAATNPLSLWAQAQTCAFQKASCPRGPRCSANTSSLSRGSAEARRRAFRLIAASDR